jgi:hypothetical protein
MYRVAHRRGASNRKQKTLLNSCSSCRFCDGGCRDFYRGTATVTTDVVTFPPASVHATVIV